MVMVIGCIVPWLLATGFSVGDLWFNVMRLPTTVQKSTGELNESDGQRQKRALEALHSHSHFLFLDLYGVFGIELFNVQQ
jgi:hypothetical protein